MIRLGAEKDEIDTPALLIDLDVMERNIETMAEFFRSVPAELRPHAKTHKCPIISHKQLEAGVIGITCAKLGEAEVMVESGIRSVLVANQVVGEPKVARLVNLAKHSDVMVAVDSQGNVSHLAESSRVKGVKLNVLIEVDARAICDAGLKTITTEFGLPPVVGVEGVVYERASEEHGRLRVEPGTGLRVGDKIELLVTHCCTNTNLFDRFHCLRDGRLEAVLKIAVRGRSQ